MKTNPMLLIAGIGIGAFVYALVTQLGAPQPDEPAPLSIESTTLITDDVAELRARLAASQRRVARLENMLSAATLAEGKIQQLKNPGEENEIQNFAALIDKSKPVLRALILPEIERSMANGEWRNEHQLGRWVNQLDLTEQQQAQLRAELDILAKQRAENFIEQLEDDQTSMFSLFQEMADREVINDPEVDAIYARHLDGEQLDAYQDARFQERLRHVDTEAANRLDLINHHIPDLSESQQDRIYTALARSSKAFTPDMQVSVGDQTSLDNSPLSAEQRYQAIESVLEPHQLGDWKTYRKREEILSGIDQW